MADLLDRDPEEILREARAHMNPTVYDRGRVSQKLAATRRTWDGQSGVDGGPLPDPFSTGAKFAAAAGKLGSWNMLAGSVVGIMLAAGGAYLALSGSSALNPPSPAQQAEASAPNSEREEVAASVPSAMNSLPPPSADLPSATSAQAESERVAVGAAVAVDRPEAVAGTANVPSRSRSDDAEQASDLKPSRRAQVRREAARSDARAATQDGYSQQAAAASGNENIAAALPSAPVEADRPDEAAALPGEVPAAQPVPVVAPQPTIDPLLEDISLLKRAAETLYRGDARSAESLLREHARRFPKSQTRFERYALGFAAACALGDTKTADEHRTSLLREAPRSALSARVRAGCGKSKP